MHTFSSSAYLERQRASAGSQGLHACSCVCLYVCVRVCWGNLHLGGKGGGGLHKHACGLKFLFAGRDCCPICRT